MLSLVKKKKVGRSRTAFAETGEHGTHRIPDLRNVRWRDSCSHDAEHRENSLPLVKEPFIAYENSGDLCIHHHANRVQSDEERSRLGLRERERVSGVFLHYQHIHINIHHHVGPHHLR